MAELKLNYYKLQTVMDCPRRYEYRYLLRKPVRMKGRAFTARVYRNAIGTLMQAQLEDVPSPKASEVFEGLWENELVLERQKKLQQDHLPVEEIDWEGETQEKYKNIGIKLIRQYNEMMLPAYMVLAVKPEYTYALDWTESSVGDRVELFSAPDALVRRANIFADTPKTVVIHRMVGKQLTQFVLERDLESTFHLMVSEAGDFEFHEAVTGPGGGAQARGVKRSRDDVEWLKWAVGEWVRMIETGLFPPNPASRNCSMEGCQFYTECRLGWR